MALKRIETAVYRNGHLMTCPHNDGFNKTCRHHAIVHAIKRVLDVFHVYSTHEPSYLSYVLRPDLHVSGRFASIIDVTVVDSVMSGLLDALQTAANEKHVKYDALAERCPAQAHAGSQTASGCGSRGGGAHSPTSPRD